MGRGESKREGEMKDRRREGQGESSESKGEGMGDWERGRRKGEELSDVYDHKLLLLLAVPF